jgi:hypothetical protein
MNRYNMVVAAVALAALSGCATPPTPPAAEQPDDKAYVTGSRIPVRDNSTSADVKGISDKRSIDDMVRPSGYIRPKSN